MLYLVFNAPSQVLYIYGLKGLQALLDNLVCLAGSVTLVILNKDQGYGRVLPPTFTTRSEPVARDSITLTKTR